MHHTTTTPTTTITALHNGCSSQPSERCSLSLSATPTPRATPGQSGSRLPPLPVSVYLLIGVTHTNTSCVHNLQEVTVPLLFTHSIHPWGGWCDASWSGS
jgi:hypothetical protein